MSAPSVRAFADVLRGEGSRFAGAVALAATTLLAGTALLGTSAWLLASAALRPSIAELQVAIVGVRALGLGRGVLRYLERLMTHDITLRVLARLRSSVFRALASAEESPTLRRGSGDLQARAVEDVAALEGVTVRILVPAAAGAISGLVAVWFLWTRSAGAGLAALAGLLVGGAIVPVLVAGAAASAGRRLAETTGRLFASLVDSVQGVGDLVVFGREEDHVREVRALACAQAEDQLRLSLLSAASGALAGLVADLTAALALAAAVIAFRSRGLSGVQLAVVALVTLAAFEAVTPLPAAFHALGQVGQSAGRLLELLRAPRRPTAAAREEASNNGQRASVPGEPLLRVRRLTFRFPGEAAPVVRDVSFTVSAAERVALVGPSGSGKSTLARLAAGLLPAPPDTVSIGGHDIATLQPETFPGVSFFSAQDAYIFTGSLRENLLLAREGASEAALHQAVDTAGLGGAVERWPDGLNTAVGEQGARLSGGERQRLVLARALVTGARLLLLDEPTAHLDAIAEREVFRGLLDTPETQGLLVITHRVVALGGFDRIVVLDEGRIVETGTLAELEAAGGLFARMLALQRSVEALGDAVFRAGVPRAPEGRISEGSGSVST